MWLNLGERLFLEKVMDSKMEDDALYRLFNCIIRRHILTGLYQIDNIVEEEISMDKYCPLISRILINYIVFTPWLQGRGC